MLLLGLDLETTIEPKVEDSKIIEVGACSWDTERKCPVQILSSLVSIDRPTALSPETTALTGITSEMLVRYGEPIEDVLERLSGMEDSCDFIVAHNGNEFDKIVLCKYADYLIAPWIDTMTDVPYPESITTRKLSFLAAEHGFLNPFPHRAVFDVMTMLKILECYDLQEVIALSKSPTIQCTAHVSFDDKQKAKSLGYWWLSNRKLWVKNFKECMFEHQNNLAEKAGFRITRNPEVYKAP